jgi:hypothetical protein
MTAAAPPRLGPRGERLYRRTLLAGIGIIPVLAALYGLHRAGGVGAGDGFVLGLIGVSIAALAAVHLLNWLIAPPAAPLWRYERLYWSASISIALVTLAAVAVAIAGDPLEAKGADRLVDAALAGLVAGAVFLFLAGRLHAWLMWLKGPASGERPETAASGDALAPILAELEAVRVETGRHIRRRAARMTPLGAAAGLAAWALFVLATREFDLILPVVALAVGALAGHVVAAQALAVDYERRYKARVLPLLVARFGALTFGPPPHLDLAALRDWHVFNAFSSMTANDGIAGDYHGRAVGIIQLDLERGWGVWRRLVFRGLLIEIGLSGRFLGTTAVVADAGPFGNFRRELAARSIRRVGLESPAFERDYEVYATDQVTARALLTPSVMARFVALGALEGFTRPVALAQDNVLRLAIPRSEAWNGSGHLARKMYEDFFAAPYFEDTAFDSAVFERLSADIGTVLRTLDAVIALER